MNSDIGSLLGRWKKKNIKGYSCPDKKSALSKVLEIVPPGASVGFSGSVTLDQLEAIRALEARGNVVFNHNKPGISREESLKIRRDSVSADYYLASANAVSLTGELVFFSAYGNRTSAISYAKNVIIICGANKVTANLGEALKRAREYATPLNCKRLNWNTPCFKDGICHNDICIFPEYKRMCCQALIIEAEIIDGRFNVIMVDENLGY